MSTCWMACDKSCFFSDMAAGFLYRFARRRRWKGFYQECSRPASATARRMQSGMETGDDPEVEGQHEQHQADDEGKPGVVEGHDHSFADRLATNALQDQEHHVTAVQKRDR